MGDYVNVPVDVLVSLDETDTIWCPTARDTHIQHAMVSKTARHYRATTKCQLMFYTVDMESFQVPLPRELRVKKKAALADLFPSQKVLLANEKYHLFEGYSMNDHFTTRAYKVGHLNVKMRGYNPPTDILKVHDNELDVDYLNRLIVNHYDRINVSTIVVSSGNGISQVEFNG
jgi:hypothetical protein